LLSHCLALATATGTPAATLLAPGFAATALTAGTPSGFAATLATTRLTTVVLIVAFVFIFVWHIFLLDRFVG
jgi:hypothetical protein